MKYIILARLSVQIILKLLKRSKWTEEIVNRSYGDEQIVLGAIRQLNV